ncbi:MAG: response regulator [Caldilineaceae bacterium]
MKPLTNAQHRREKTEVNPSPKAQDKVARDITILIIEDDLELRFLLEKSLQKGNYQTIGITFYAEADPILTTTKVDLILLDIAEQDIDELQLDQNLRIQYGIPMIMLSVHIPERAKACAKRLGADAYLTKPVRLADLYRIIENLSANRAYLEAP